MIKILFLINYLNNGGPSNVVCNLAKGLNKKKYKVYILTLFDLNNDKVINDLKENNVEIIALNYKKCIRNLFVSRKKISKIINNISPHIIHIHGIVFSVMSLFYKISSFKIVTIHNNIYEDYKYTYGRIRGFIYSKIHILTLKKVNKVVCCSKTSYDNLKKNFGNCSYVRNGVNSPIPTISRKEIREQLNISETSIIYIYAGNLSRLKRINDMVNMFNKFLSGDEYLLIVGEGKCRNVAEKKSTNNNIKFLGYKNDIINYLNASDVYVSFSSSEGFSISIIEALQSKLLLLLSNIPSHNECLNIDKNYYIGECFEMNDFYSKKNIIRKKLNNVSKNDVFNFYNKYLSQDAMTKEYEKIYDEVIK